MVFRSPVKYMNSYIDLNALDTSGFGTMVTGRWISLALLLCHIIFSFCYLTSKSSSPWNLTPLFCCLLTRYTKILHLKSACLPCFAGYPNPTQVQDQRPSSTLYLHNKKDKPSYPYFYIVLFRPPPSSPKKQRKK